MKIQTPDPLTLARAYRAVPRAARGAHWQLGARALKLAGQLAGRNPERMTELLWAAHSHLPYAQARSRRYDCALLPRTMR